MSGRQDWTFSIISLISSRQLGKRTKVLFLLLSRMQVHPFSISWKSVCDRKLIMTTFRRPPSILLPGLNWGDFSHPDDTIFIAVILRGGWEDIKWMLKHTNFSTKTERRRSKLYVFRNKLSGCPVYYLFWNIHNIYLEPSDGFYWSSLLPSQSRPVQSVLVWFILS